MNASIFFEGNQTMSRKFTIHFFAAVACALTLSACSTTSAVKTPPPPPTLDELMGKANLAASSGNKEAAMGLWKQAAEAYPADKTPWVNMAQTRYEAGQYGDAIVHAQEVLVRDPANNQANSVIAISGLRLSTRALADLSRQNNLSADLRTESRDLAKLLRESLGETVLVPVPTAAQARDKPPPRLPPRKGQGKAADSSANPFDGLK